MLSLLSLSLFVVAAPLPAPKVPVGPAPRIVVVVDTDTDGIYFDVAFEEVTKTGIIYLRDEQIEVFDRDGSCLKPADVRKRLTPLTPVLFSTDGKAIHPSHLERHREVMYSVVYRIGNRAVQIKPAGKK